MRKVLKYIIERTYKPVLERYLSKTRWYTYKGIRLEIPPGVFHPRFFLSTKFLMNYISHKKLNRQSVLELGAGSGLISIYAARLGAFVTATDINPVAVTYLKKNMASNGVAGTVLQSDLFVSLPKKTYNLIVVNPPYYKKDPSSFSDYAWYCGENGEYFQHLFAGLSGYIHYYSAVYMVLCDGCDIDMIRLEAGKRSFRMVCVDTARAFMEKHYIFEVQQLPCIN